MRGLQAMWMSGCACCGSTWMPPCVSLANWRLPWSRSAPISARPAQPSPQPQCCSHLPRTWHLPLCHIFTSAPRHTLPCPPASLPPPQKGGGAIINLSSVAALKGVPDEAAYCTSKAGMRGWSLACYQVSSAPRYALQCAALRCAMPRCAMLPWSSLPMCNLRCLLPVHTSSPAPGS